VWQQVEKDTKSQGIQGRVKMEEGLLMHLSIIISPKICKFCSKYYYPPQGFHMGSAINCKAGKYLPLCGNCKGVRKNEMLRKKRKFHQFIKNINKFSIKDVILSLLLTNELKYENSPFSKDTTKHAILRLRKDGYDIRTANTYLLVREPKDII